jgi:geranylgeranylglycerol-phosphate geranylgeranyltransferase
MTAIIIGFDLSASWGDIMDQPAPKKPIQDISSTPTHPHFFDAALGLLQICQPVVALVAAIYTLLGVFLSTGTEHLIRPTTIGAMLVVFAIVAYSFAINAFCDFAEDQLNAPQRPIPSGTISRRAALTLALGLALVGMLIAIFLGIIPALFALANITLSGWYSFALKNTVLVGNAVIALLNASILGYGGLVAGRETRAIWLAMALVFLFTLAQETLYMMRDAPGDAQTGMRTVATWLGIRKTTVLFRLFIGVFTIATLAMGITRFAPRAFLYAVIICTLLPLGSIVLYLGHEPGRPKIERALLALNITWFVSVIPIVAMK